MDFKSRTNVSATLTPDRASGVTLKDRNNEDINKSIQKSPEQTRSGNINFPLMISRRTPLRSPNTSFIINRDFSFKREEKMPVKRCFSKEVLELSRKQIILTKQSKVDISMHPPKRLRLDAFSFSSSDSQNRHRTVQHTSSSLIVSNSRRNEELKRLKPPPPQQKLSLLPPEDKCGTKQTHPKRDGVKPRSGNSTLQVPEKKKNERLKTSHFLIAVKNFPHEEWKENNNDADMLREVIFLSDARAVPVTLFRNGNEFILKFSNATNSELYSRTPLVTREGIALYDIIKSPFTLSFKIISGVIRWIVGS